MVPLISHEGLIKFAVEPLKTEIIAVGLRSVVTKDVQTDRTYLPCIMCPSCYRWYYLFNLFTPVVLTSSTVPDVLLRNGTGRHGNVTFIVT